MSEHDFREWLEGWAPFYTAVAAAAATLSGLLFVALSLNRERLVAAGHRDSLRSAVRSFGDFLFVLGISLVMLMPKMDAPAIGLILVILGLLRIYRIVKHWRNPQYRHLRQRSAREVAWEYAFPVGSCLALAAIGVRIWQGHGAAMYFVVGILLELISTASYSAWRLLMME